jgi:nucleoside-diphosphate-sugar epimerase
MRIVITGAAGQIGKQLVDELSGIHEIRLIDRHPIKGRESYIADLSRSPARTGWRDWFKARSARWGNAFKGARVVIHLAANIDPLAPWESILPNNIHGTWNVISAAATYRVERVIFASSNWVTKALEKRLAPDCYRSDGPKIDSETAPLPLTPYGLSKSFGELAGRMFVEEQKLKSFIAVRIGHYAPNPSKDEMLRARWIGVEDIRSLFRRCVETELEGFHVVYGISAQTTAPYDLSHTRKLLDWEPQQNAAKR